jgi:hypothetical protein
MPGYGVVAPPSPASIKTSIRERPGGPPSLPSRLTTSGFTPSKFKLLFLPEALIQKFDELVTRAKIAKWPTVLRCESLARSPR